MCCHGQATCRPVVMLRLSILLHDDGMPTEAPSCKYEIEALISFPEAVKLFLAAVAHLKAQRVVRGPVPLHVPLVLEPGYLPHGHDEHVGGGAREECNVGLQDDELAMKLLVSASEAVQLLLVRWEAKQFLERAVRRGAPLLIEVSKAPPEPCASCPSACICERRLRTPNVGRELEKILGVHADGRGPVMLQRLHGREAPRWVHGETAADEILGLVGDVGPVLVWEGILAALDLGVHLRVRAPVEGG
mmetsp:Transcript_18895/g.50817  ORF Transcript_18895/g.50817 Transcript_18895/m.50817 type:complete len:247 (+) Transcript_18895:490-1230(+)